MDKEIDTICPLCLTRRLLSWDAAHTRQCCGSYVWFYEHWKKDPPVKARVFELSLLPNYERYVIEEIARNNPDYATATGSNTNKPEPPRMEEETS